RGVGRLGEQAPRLGFAEAAVADELPVVEQDAFFVDVLAGGRHGAGSDAADFAVVTTGGDVEQDLLGGAVEDRGDHGDIGQVGAAVVGVVHGVHRAAFHLPAVAAHHLLDRGAHRS